MHISKNLKCCIELYSQYLLKIYGLLYGYLTAYNILLYKELSRKPENNKIIFQRNSKSNKIVSIANCGNGTSKNRHTYEVK